MFSGFGSVFSNVPSNAPQTFQEHYRCFPILMMPDSSRKDDANFAGKIFLPPLALARLTTLHIRYPMLFRIASGGKCTHTGVLEFTAEEGRVYVPQWAADALAVNPGQVVSVETCDLPLGNYVKIEPQLVDFLDISDPKAVLENALRNFSCLSVDDIIQISYNDTVYGIKVLSAKPENCVCVVETDLETEFAPPVGYVEPQYEPKPVSAPKPVGRGAGAAKMADAIGYAGIVANATRAVPSFTGHGQKLSGKAAETKQSPVSVADLDLDAPPAPLPLPLNQLFFGFPIVPLTPDESDAEAESAVRFEGAGQLLRQSKKRRDTSDAHVPLKNHSRSPPDIIEID